MNAKNANSVKQLNRVLDDRRICRSWRHCLDGKRLPALLLRPKPLHPGICERAVARYWSANLPPNKVDTSSQIPPPTFFQKSVPAWRHRKSGLERPFVCVACRVRLALRVRTCPARSDGILNKLGLLGRPENNGLEGVVQRPLQSLDAHRI